MGRGRLQQVVCYRVGGRVAYETWSEEGAVMIHSACWFPGMHARAGGCDKELSAGSGKKFGGEDLFDPLKIGEEDRRPQ